MSVGNLSQGTSKSAPLFVMSSAEQMFLTAVCTSSLIFTSISVIGFAYSAPSSKIGFESVPLMEGVGRMKFSISTSCCSGFSLSSPSSPLSEEELELDELDDEELSCRFLSFLRFFVLEYVSYICVHILLFKVTIPYLVVPCFFLVLDASSSFSYDPVNGIRRFFL